MKGYRKICGKPWEASNENSLYHDQSTPVTDYKPATIVVEGTISWRGSICFSLLMDIIYALSLSYLKELKNTFVFQKLFWDMMDRKPSDYQILSLLFWFVFWSGYKTDSVTEKGNKTWGHFSVKLFLVYMQEIWSWHMTKQRWCSRKTYFSSKRELGMCKMCVWVQKAYLTNMVYLTNWE